MKFKSPWPDGPSQVALFAYDNNTFTEEKKSAAASDVRISNPGKVTRLKNLVTGEIIEGKLPPRRSDAGFTPEGAREAASASAN